MDGGSPFTEPPLLPKRIIASASEDVDVFESHRVNGEGEDVVLPTCVSPQRESAAFTTSGTSRQSILAP